jgi:hypothetical protein
MVLAALLAALLAVGAAVFFLNRPADTALADGDTTESAATATETSSSAQRARSSRTASSSASSSRGPVPPVTGLTLASAQSALINEGFRVDITELLDDTVADNTVTAQDPVEGTRADRGDTVTLTVARRPVAVYLSRLAPVGSDLDSSGGAAVQMNGEAYIRALTAGTNCDRSVGVDYDLGRHYRTLKGLVGVTDASASAAQVQFDVIVDGRNVYSQTTKLGAPVAMDVDVTQGLRLELRATRIDADCDYDTRATAVWADPQLFGAPGEVPSPTATPTN